MAADAPIHPSPSIDRLSPIFIAGPTAVGKSELALLLAEKLNGEIISVDSMQVYRGLDIGTAKPSRDERARIPHHLIDVVELGEPFDAATFVSLAQKAVAEIQSRGCVPIFCGGTGLYFKAYLEGLGEAPSSDPALRAQLEATPLPDLLRELAERDPVTYEKIDRQNPRRVFRAVEVIRLTGKPFSEQRADWQTQSPKPETRNLFGLARSSEDLQQRINVRVDEMFRRGLVEETEQLLKRGLAENRNAMQAIGYRQVVEHLRGERSLPDTIELVKSRTRKFAKRQMTWFRGQLGVGWLEMGSATDLREACIKLQANLPL
jgi:tRNA dimethylallyltransferase